MGTNETYPLYLLVDNKSIETENLMKINIAADWCSM